MLRPLSETDAPPAPQLVADLRVLGPARGGILKPALGAAAVGTIVPQGTLLGELLDPATFATLERFEAPFARNAILLLRPHLTALEAGAMTYILAPVN